MKKNNNSLLDSLNRMRIPLYIFAGFIFIAVIVTFVVIEINRNNAEESIRRIEDAEEMFSEWKEEGEDDSVELDTIQGIAKEVIASYPRQYGAARAYFMLASIAWELKHHEDAAEYFQQLAVHFPSNYLAPISMYNAAVALEEIAETTHAMTLYQDIVDQYSDSLEAPRALFSLGRLNESVQAYEQAVAHYRQLNEDYSDSQWANLSKSRTLYLEIQGLVGEIDAAKAEETE